MTQREADLPDFRRPPIAESVFGVQFDSLSRLRVTDFGRIWDEFKDEYPEVEEHPPLEPTFEVFGDQAPPNPAPRLQFLPRPPLPRLFFVNQDRDRLLQIQRNRFVGNWRKVGEDDEYPHFPANVKAFHSAYDKLQRVVDELGAGPIVPNQCELTYINPIPLISDGSTLATFQVFEDLPEVEGLGAAEDGGFNLRYLIRSTEGAPIGRLIATATPAWRSNGSRVMQFGLTARGAPASADIEAVMDFFKIGHAAIVNAFTQLTTERMHKVWERFQ